jgi:hypothetical protein
MNLESKIRQMLKEIEEELAETKDRKERISLFARYDSLLSKLLQLERLDTRRKERKKLVPKDVILAGKKLCAIEVMDDD